MQFIKKSVYKWIENRFMDGCSHYNSLEVRKSCRSKKQARDIFQYHNVPHAKGLIFFNPMKAYFFAKKHGFPLVIKPNVSGFSRGSHFPINSYKELWKAIFLAKLWWPTTVVEQYLQGKNYRIVAIKRQVMSVVERYAPCVIGDGIHHIQALIENENKVRESKGLYPCISPLSSGPRTIKYLKKQKLTLSSVPEKGEVVDLYYRISLAQGGVVGIQKKSKIAAQNTELFLSILDMFGANILGIDVIFEKSIEVPFNEQKCIFLEVNSRPFLTMHDYPRYGEKEDLSSYIQLLDKLDIANSHTF
jgi:D-alanine-D-alanine ligase-like ATP-grasp enzyme